MKGIVDCEKQLSAVSFQLFASPSASRRLKLMADG